MSQFDLKTHHRDKKGHIVRTTPYRLRVVNGVQKFERPIGSGKWYDAQNNLVEETEPTVVEEAAPLSAVELENHGEISLKLPAIVMVLVD
jgi:hypothetical protein